MDLTTLQLNGGPLDGNILTVTSEVEHQDTDEPHVEGAPLDQSDKPRAGSKLTTSLTARLTVPSRSRVSCSWIYSF